MIKKTNDNDSRDHLEYLHEIMKLKNCGIIVCEYIKKPSIEGNHNILWDRLETIKCDFQLLYSEKDNIVPCFDSNIISKLKNVKSLKVCVVSNASHSDLIKIENVNIWSELLLNDENWKNPKLYYYYNTKFNDKL